MHLVAGGPSLFLLSLVCVCQFAARFFRMMGPLDGGVVQKLPLEAEEEGEMHFRGPAWLPRGLPLLHRATAATTSAVRAAAGKSGCHFASTGTTTAR